MRCLWQNSLVALGSLAATAVEAQTYSSCNPLNSNSCPADTALGMTINVDFTQGAVNSFAASGSPTYDKTNGVSFTVSKGGDAPQLMSLFYIMFGRVEVTMKAAPGAGIVSSLVLESDVLDEIDIEWLGSDADEVQSNYFGKGQVTSYNRGQFHDLTGTQSKWITYTVDWTKDKIVWMADGTILRSMTESQAESGQYPQTPMRVKLGAWAGGDPNYNAAGTVKWARGPTDYSKGPFSMMVKKLVVTDYSTGKAVQVRRHLGRLGVHPGRRRQGKREHQQQERRDRHGDGRWERLDRRRHPRGRYRHRQGCHGHADWLALGRHRQPHGRRHPFRLVHDLGGQDHARVNWWLLISQAARVLLRALGPGPRSTSSGHALGVVSISMALSYIQQTTKIIWEPWRNWMLIK
ncbi:hypothetical protein V2G26_013984 [Clonostachys chloroleuca]